MKSTTIDLSLEDIDEMNRPDSPSVAMTTEDVRMSKSSPIVIKYDYADLENTDYHFAQPFHNRDTYEYFRKMKMISSNTIESLITKAREYHFYRSDIRGNLGKAIRELFRGKRIDPDTIIYHIALYNDHGVTADRAKDVRSPRIYFMLGNYGFIYPLFFDPYHELNPM